MPLTSNDIDYILQHHKWKFTVGFIWARYFLMILPISFIANAVIIIIVGLIEKDKYTTLQWLLLSSAFLFLGLFFAIFMIRRVEAERKFLKVKTNGVSRDAITHLVRDIKWTILEKNNQYIIAGTYMSAFSWGEEVTIIFNGKEVLFNSRSRGSQPFTLNRDRVNARKFVDALESSITNPQA